MSEMSEMSEMSVESDDGLRSGSEAEDGILSRDAVRELYETVLRRAHEASGTGIEGETLSRLVDAVVGARDRELHRLRQRLALADELHRDGLSWGEPGVGDERDEREREWELGDVLSITTGVLLSERRMAGVHEILDWLTGDTLMTHQLPRAMDAVASWILQQHPWLAPVKPPSVTGDVTQEAREMRIRVWLELIEQRLGGTVRLRPMPVGAWEPRNPIVELLEMRAGTREDGGDDGGEPRAE